MMSPLFLHPRPGRIHRDGLGSSTVPEKDMTASARSFPHTALAAAVVLLIGCAFAAPAFAQEDDYEDKPRTSTGSGTAAAASERARQRKAQAQAQASKQPELFPLATRKAPENKVSQKDAKTANKIQADFDAGKYAEVMAQVDAFGAESQNAYLKSYLYQLAANAAQKLEDDARAADYYLKTVQTDGLDNNGHYQIMFNLAVTLNTLDRDQEALTWTDRYLAETKNESEQALGLKAFLLSKLDRAAEGAALYEKMLAAKPGDRAVLMNAVSLYQQAENYDKANALLEDARGKGLLKDANEYRTLFVGYINANKYREAENVLLDGVAKGAIPPSQTLANDLSILAQNYYGEENVAKAIEFYRRAAEVSTNGEPALNLAKVLRNENRIAEAKAAARDALAKGVKKPKEANDILALPGK
jgi:tetratricopeptide (TPR) repeat protein